MWKLIFLALVVYLVISIAKRMLANSHGTKSNDTTTNNANRVSEDNSSESMVQCNTCQIHLPRSEAFMVDGKFYCSHAHIGRTQS